MVETADTRCLQHCWNYKPCQMVDANVQRAAKQSTFSRTNVNGRTDSVTRILLLDCCADGQRARYTDIDTVAKFKSARESSGVPRAGHGTESCNGCLAANIPEQRGEADWLSGIWIGGPAETIWRLQAYRGC